jgi:hypothetical protein
MSARTGAGCEGLVALLEQEGEFGRRVLDIDYDIYADGEAELGWLNASIRVTAPQEFKMDELLRDIVARLARSLNGAGAETAHLKAIGLWEGFFGVVNLISRDHVPEVSLPSHCTVREFDLIVNARVAIDPALLQEAVTVEVNAACATVGALAEFRQTQSFRPGRPTPTHRYAVAK